MDVATLSDVEFEKSKRTLSTEYADDSANCIKSWPVQLSVPEKAFYIKGTRKIRCRPYRFKQCMKNRFLPLDGPMSMDHIHFLLDCFVVSAGPGPIQLGRYHPQSDPEAYARKENEEEEFEDKWSFNSDDDEDFWAKVGLPNHKESPSLKDASTSSLTPWRDDFLDTVELPPRATSLKVISRPAFIFNELMTPDDVIARELSEMRLVLERLLDNHDIADWEHPHEIRNILDLLPEDITPKEPFPHYPVGDWEFDVCGICFDAQWLYRRACCHFPACQTCLQKYFSCKIEDGQVKIECCSTTCNSYVHRDEISAKLGIEDKEKFHKLLVLANQDANTKTCPRCSHVISIANKPKKISEQKFPCVICQSCQLEWCFNCHAPWHDSLSCRQFRKGDRLLRSWARERNHGQLNAQKCPKCKIYIQRTTGCDHMHCTRCMTDFCYKCGERFRYLKFFGDHYSKLSIFGCKYRFKADQPLQRKAIRGAIFGGKLVAAPLLGALALCAGALAVGISLFALPVYGGVRLYRHCEGRKTSKAVRRSMPSSKYFPNVNVQCLYFPDN